MKIDAVEVSRDQHVGRVHFDLDERFSSTQEDSIWHTRDQEIRGA